MQIHVSSEYQDLEDWKAEPAFHYKLINVKYFCIRPQIEP